jgi:hypothetical protein
VNPNKPESYDKQYYKIHKVKILKQQLARRTNILEQRMIHDKKLAELLFPLL